LIFVAHVNQQAAINSRKLKKIMDYIADLWDRKLASLVFFAFNILYKKE